jgi:dodecin
VSVAKIIELTAKSNESFDAAVKEGLAKAGETLRNVTHAWVDGQEVEIEDGQPVYQVHLKVTFILE